MGRAVFVCVLMAVFSIGSYLLSHKLIAQIYYEQGKSLSEKGRFGLAMVAMEKAHKHDSHNLSLSQAYGDACLTASQVSRNRKTAKDRAAAALELFETAVAENPLDVGAVFGLGKAQAVLAELFPESMEPCAFLDCFRQAVILRPNGVNYNLHLAKALGVCHKDEELKLVVRRLASVYPPCIYQMLRESYWSPTLVPSMKQGLAEAIRQENLPRQAHQAMASVLEKEGDYPGAIKHYKDSLAFLSFENSSNHFIRLGSLLLKNEQPQEAFQEFFSALSYSQFLERDMETIFNIYRREKALKDFGSFYRKVVKDYYVSPRIKMLVGRSLFELKNWKEAQEIFEDLASGNENGEAWYWLARIAGENQDWPAMELYIQKATVLEPENAQYHLMFSQVLQRIGKHERAEKQASLAIACKGKASPWLYNHRANVRWSLQDFQGALEDWQMAIRLNSDRASFYAQAGRACEQLGRKAKAREYYNKALELSPSNPSYTKLVQQTM
ncbi:MAG: tetratricopeptide repeat protein [Desulfatibacillum sp.]|nr:tetratricopeptide repeat protein [Desulfatibacillum sp.]